jgi:hypothetical protein
VIEIHVAVVVAVQAQVVADAVTVLACVPPAAGIEWAAGDTVKVHWAGGAGAAACWTVTVRPATVNAPVRALWAVFGATVKRTSPFPVPVLPCVMVIHDAFDRASQAHVFAEGVTVTLPGDSSCGTLKVSGATVKVQVGCGAGAAACWTVTVRPATASVPVLAV